MKTLDPAIASEALEFLGRLGMAPGEAAKELEVAAHTGEVPTLEEGMTASLIVGAAVEALLSRGATPERIGGVMAVLMSHAAALAIRAATVPTDCAAPGAQHAIEREVSRAAN